jgi:hypothetical protein
MRAAAVADREAAEAKRLRASLMRFAPDLPAAVSNRPILPTKALAARPAQTILPRMKVRKSRPSCSAAPVPARLPIHFYCKERSARASPGMAREDLARTDWCPATLLEKVGKVRVADAEARAAVDPEVGPAVRADLAGPAAGVAVAECSAELLLAEEQAEEEECLAAAAD